MSREYRQLLQQHRRAAARLGELDVFLTGLRHMAHDAPFTTDAERIEAIRGMFAGTVKVRAVPTLNPGELKLEFYRLPVATPEGTPELSVTEGVTTGAET